MNLQSYITYLQEKNLSLNTITNYPVAIKQYGNQTINTPNLQEHVKNLLKKYEIASIQTKIAALKSYAKFRKWKADWERILNLVPKIQKKFFATINEEELAQLKQARFEKQESLWQRNNLILDFLLYSGLRVSELVNLKHSDYQNDSLRILGKGNKIRFVLITPDLVKKINSYSSDYLFTNTYGQKLTREYIVKLIRKRTLLAQIKKRITPHTFRRSFATLLNSRKCNLTTIQKLLGHSQLQTTANYIHNDYQTIYEDYSKLWRKEPGVKTTENIFSHVSNRPQ